MDNNNFLLNAVLPSDIPPLWLIIEFTHPKNFRLTWLRSKEILLDDLSVTPRYFTEKIHCLCYNLLGLFVFCFDSVEVWLDSLLLVQIYSHHALWRWSLLVGKSAWNIRLCCGCTTKNRRTTSGCRWTASSWCGAWLRTHPAQCTKLRRGALLALRQRLGVDQWPTPRPASTSLIWTNSFTTIQLVAFSFCVFQLCRLICPFDAHCCHMGTAMKHPVPDRVKRSFVIFDIWALWFSVERQSARMSKITNDRLIGSGTGCFIL